MLPPMPAIVHFQQRGRAAGIRRAESSRPDERAGYDRGGNICSDAPAFYHWLGKLEFILIFSARNIKLPTFLFQRNNVKTSVLQKLTD